MAADAMSIRVSCPPGISRLTYRLYKISFRSVSGVVDVDINRRYSDFEWLRKQLMTSFPAVLIPGLPPKILMMHLERSPELLEERRRGLEEFLVDLAKMAFPVASLAFQAFVVANKSSYELEEFKKRASKAIRTRTPDNLCQLYKSLYPDVATLPPHRNRNSLIFSLKDYLGGMHHAVRRAQLSIETHIDKVNSLNTQIQSFTKQLGDLYKLDDQFVDAPSASRRTDMRDILKYISSVNGSGMQDWDVLATRLHDEAKSIPRMQEVLAGWTSLQGSRNLSRRVENITRRKTISDLRVEEEKTSELPEIVTNVVLRSELPRYWRKNIGGFSESFQTFATSEKKRLKGLYSLCYNQIGKNRQFGRHIEYLPAVQSKFGPLPRILYLLRKRLEESGGLLTKGIFRISAKSSELDTWRTWINQDLDSLKRLNDVHIASNLLKLFLRRLPIPILSTDEIPVKASNPLAKQTNSSKESKLNSIQDSKLLKGWERMAAQEHEERFVRTIRDLPMRRKAILLWLVDFAASLALHKEENLMSINNLTRVLSPNLVEFSPSGLRLVADFFECVLDVYSRHVEKEIQEEKLRQEEAKAKEENFVQQRLSALQSPEKDKDKKSSSGSPETVPGIVRERRETFSRLSTSRPKLEVKRKDSDLEREDVKYRIARARSHFSKCAREHMANSPRGMWIHGSLSGRSLYYLNADKKKPKMPLAIREKTDEKQGSLSNRQAFKGADLDSLAEFYASKDKTGLSVKSELLKILRMRSKIRRLSVMSESDREGKTSAKKKSKKAPRSWFSLGNALSYCRSTPLTTSTSEIKASTGSDAEGRNFLVPPTT